MSYSQMIVLAAAAAIALPALYRWLSDRFSRGLATPAATVATVTAPAAPGPSAQTLAELDALRAFSELLHLEHTLSERGMPRAERQAKLEPLLLPLILTPLPPPTEPPA